MTNGEKFILIVGSGIIVGFISFAIFSAILHHELKPIVTAIESITNKYDKIIIEN